MMYDTKETALNSKKSLYHKRTNTEFFSKAMIMSGMKIFDYGVILSTLSVPPLKFSLEELKNPSWTRKEFCMKDLTLKDFEILEKLGEGAEGSVYLVRDEVENNKYAIKLLPNSKGLGIRKSGMKLQTNEAKILKIFDHPFITKIYKTFEDKGSKFLLLEFWNGKDLYYHSERVMKRGKKFSEKSVKFYISGLILALSYIHECGYIHRDLKPENVLLDWEGYPKLWDFGLSISRQDIDFKTCKKLSGTREYFSPEMIKGELYDKEVDWWGLGVLTYELLYHTTPFKNDNIFVLNNNIKTQTPCFSDRDDISSECIHFVSKLLWKDKKKRLGQNGLKDFKDEPWLADVDWEAMESKVLEAPFDIKKNLSSMHD